MRSIGHYVFTLLADLFVAYRVLYDNPTEDIITRLCKVRNITDSPDDFLQPSFGRYWTPWEVLSDFAVGTQRIADAIRRGEKTMIFGDYDVDGIMASYVMYVGLRQFLGAEHISVRLPHRAKDGYGIKSYHVDEVAALWCWLIITVDNGISSHIEAAHAKTLWVDMVITDHHLPSDTLPDAYAVINPQCSLEYPQKEICGATVALKVVLGVADALGVDRRVKKDILHRCLPFVSIATVADCMPLVGENRLIVKKWLEMMNTHRSQIAPVLQTMLEQLQIQRVDTFHIGFMIAPRLNATGRMDSAELGLQCLLASTYEKQLAYLAQLEEVNAQRRTVQEQMIKDAQADVDETNSLIWVQDDNFHEWIVGIVAWRLADKYNKPTLVLSRDPEKWVAVGSLRAPLWGDIVSMLRTADDLLMRYGGHAQAWGLTVALDRVDEMLQRFEDYCHEHPLVGRDDDGLLVDTLLHEHELWNTTLHDVDRFGPYGEGNPEPKFALEEVAITSLSKVGKNGNSHLKIRAKLATHEFDVMQWWKWESIENYAKWDMVSVVGRPKLSSYSQEWFIDGSALFPEDSRE